jgi:hypothetical protein
MLMNLCFGKIKNTKQKMLKQNQFFNIGYIHEMYNCDLDAAVFLPVAYTRVRSFATAQIVLTSTVKRMHVMYKDGIVQDCYIYFRLPE